MTKANRLAPFRVRGPETLVVPFIFSLALAIRLIGMNSRPIWYDEAFSVLFAEKGLVSMISGTLGAENGAAADVHPLLYYTLLWGWMRVFGQSLPAVRSLSVLLNFGTLAIIYFWLKKVSAGQGETLGLFFLAMAPFQIHYAQEIRMYALLSLLIVGAAYSLWLGIKTGRWIWFAGFGFLAALAQYTHNLAVIYLVLLASIPILLRKWRAVVAVGLAGCGAIVLYLPWLIHAPAQLSKVRTAYWVTKPSPARLITALLSYVTNLPLPDRMLPLGLSVTILVTVLAIWQTLLWIKKERPALRPGEMRAGERAGLVWISIYLSIGPIVLLYLLSFWQPVFLERILLPAGVFFIIWVGWALGRLKRAPVIQWLVIGALTFSMGVGIFEHFSYRNFPYGPYRELGAYLRQKQNSGSLIVHSNKLTFLPVAYYQRGLPQKYVSDPPGSGSDTLAPPTQKALGLFASPDIAAAAGDAERLLFVIFTKALEEYQDAGYETHPHLAWLEMNYQVVEKTSWDDLVVYEYEKR